MATVEIKCGSAFSWARRTDRGGIELGVELDDIDPVAITEDLIKDDHLTGEGIQGIIEYAIEHKKIQKMEILELIGEDFARKYWGFVEVEDE